MFGYIIANKQELKVRELEKYRSYYCGLCHELHRRYGRRGQIILSYDCTFLLLLLTGTYEPEETTEKCRCIVNPAVPHKETQNRFTGYAADMNVLLAYLKAVDDWIDEKKHTSRLMAMLLHRDYLRLKEQYPRQAKAIRDSLRALRREEMSGDSVIPEHAGQDEKLAVLMMRLDRIAGLTGRFLSEMCAAEEDMWSEDLRGIGFYLGKFIYLLDAYDDLSRDEESGSFNILPELRSADPDGFDERVKELLLDLAALCCRSFERLPIVKDVNILRNILYSGIWIRFHQIRSGNTTREKRCHDRSI